jgi:hypothetical protein
MNNAADLLVILVFLAGFYTALGLLCGIVEKTQELLARPYQRRRMRRSPQRRTPRRGLATAAVGTRPLRPIAAPVREKAA